MQKKHPVIKYLTHACCDEEVKELVKAVDDHSVYKAKRYLCILSNVTIKRYLTLKSLWEPTIKKKRETDEIINSKETTRTVNSDEPEYHTPSKHLSELEWNEADINLKIEKTEDHSSVMLGQRIEKTANKTEKNEKVTCKVCKIILYDTMPFQRCDGGCSIHNGKSKSQVRNKLVM